MFSKGSCTTPQRRMSARFAAMSPSGNTAFDAYKEETLRRLEDEQSAFHEFLERLRAAKDKSEFDQFMDDRARNARNSGGSEDPATQQA